MRRRAPIISRRKAFLARAALAAKQGAAVASVLAIDGQAMAKVVNANMSVNATIGTGCLLKAAAVTLNFGAFGVFSPASTPSGLVLQTASGTVALPYLCINGSTANVEVSTSSVTLTGAANPAHKLVATLYADAGHATVFPTITPGLGLTGSGLTTSVMIYGQILPAASSAADAYAGSAILTINY